MKRPEVRSGDVGYIDCQKHPYNTQVLVRAGRPLEVVASLPCGDRFTILLYGFFYTQIDTKDRKVGYVYSNLISRDHSATSAREPTLAQVPTPTPNVAVTNATVVQPRPATPVQPQPTPAQPVPAEAPAPTLNVAVTNATVVQPRPATPIQPQPMPAQSAPAETPAPKSNVPVASATVVQPRPATPIQPQPIPAQPVPAETPAPKSNVAVTSATVVQPRPAAPMGPQPTLAQPAPEALRGKGAEPGFGRPSPLVRREPVVELFGGYAYARFNSGGYINGGLGSLGWNVRPWLQIVTDTSYSLARPSGTKDVLYASHLGPRFFYRARNKWGPSPFVEALFGISRLDTTISGPSPYQTSQRGLSIKAGGGLDLNLSPRFAIRLFDVDYYRTPFTAYSHDNISAFAGIVLRLGGGRPQ